MAKKKQPKPTKTRRLFLEVMSGVEAMREHREGSLTLRTHAVELTTLPAGVSLAARSPMD
jgi:hypothetical protein